MIISHINTQTVIVKDVDEMPLMRRLCAANNIIAFVTSEKGVKLMESGDLSIFPIGFRLENVFEYHGENLTCDINWSALKPWRESRVA